VGEQFLLSFTRFPSMFTRFPSESNKTKVALTLEQIDYIVQEKMTAASLAVSRTQFSV